MDLKAGGQVPPLALTETHTEEIHSTDENQPT